MKFSLEGKVAIITGAAGDIGIAIANSLAETGANLVLADNDLKRLDIASKQISADKSRILTVPTDVTKTDEVEALMKASVDKFKRLDILITAAGIQIRKPAIEFTKSEWEKVLEINLSGTFFCCQAAAKHMMSQKKGKIILISSLTAEIGIPNMLPYVASRGAIKQVSKALAVEWAQYGINVNCIGPGRIKTKMTEDVFSDEKTKESFMHLIPMGRPGLPSDLTGLAVFLASDASDYITGQSIYVDGGWLASGGSPLK
ncbi:MAG: glucose 1-dehydrogenase [bacterium]